MALDIDLFTRINNAVLDLQGAHFQSFERPIKELGRLLHNPDLDPINARLTKGADIDKFLKESAATEGSIVGSAKLVWPEDSEKALAIALLLIWKFSDDPRFMIGFGHKFFYSGNQLISGIHQITRQIIIPFVRDYKIYVSNYGKIDIKRSMQKSNKIFIVHGHDNATKQTVARFVEKLGFEAVILHEQPNKGRTIITKFREEAADVGFAIVLMAPDDVGKAKDATDLKPRARQNVVFELGFFIGALHPEHVAALVKGNVEWPSDFEGVVYISFDSADWKFKLAQELEAAGYEIEWQKVGHA